MQLADKEMHWNEMNSKTQRLHFRQAPFKSSVLEAEWSIHSVKGRSWEKVLRMESAKAEGLSRTQKRRHRRDWREPGQGHADSNTM